jgi:lipoate-protein ligase A
MPDPWYLLKSGVTDPATNMAIDEALLTTAPSTMQPVLRFYGWTEPAATFGYSQRYTELEKLTMLRPLIRRPTGGGLVPHDRDWTYSMAVPPHHSWYALKATESYERVHLWIRDAFARLKVEITLAPCCQKDIPGQCFIGYEKFDALWHGRKVAGAAQRRTKDGLLIQGSLQPPPIGLKREDWESAMCAVVSEQDGVVWSPFPNPATFVDIAEQLRREKYARSEFNAKR